jgi:MFS family permease
MCRCYRRVEIRTQMGSLFTAAAVQFGPHFAKQIAYESTFHFIYSYRSLKVFFSADPLWSISASEWGLLQTAVTLPIALFPWLAGRSVDKNVNVKTMLICALVITCIGQSVFVVGCHDHFIGTALLGRFIFGIGEGIVSSLAGYIAVHHRSSSRMLSIGIIQAFHALAVGLSKAVMAPIAEVCGSYVISLIGALFVCIFSFVSACKWRPEEVERTSGARIDTCESPISRHGKLCCQAPPGKLSLDFWAIASLHLLIASSHRLFGHIDAAFLGSKFRRSPAAAGILSSLTEFICIVVSPILGYILDHKRSSVTLPLLILFATISGCIGYAMLAFSERGFALEFGLMLVGAVNAISPTVMKSVVPETIHDTVLGTGLGIYESSESVGVLVGSVLIGIVAARFHDDYTHCIPAFAFIMFTAVIISVWVVVRRVRMRRIYASLYYNPINANPGGNMKAR